MTKLTSNCTVPASLALIMAALAPLAATARYADDFEGTYEDLDCKEDDCDCLEPDDNRFKVVSPSSLVNTGDTVVFAGDLAGVQIFFEDAGQTDGLTIVPPTPVKVDKFMRYVPYGINDVVATLAGHPVTAYQVAVNSVMAGCSADLMPICVAMVKAMNDADYLREISDGTRVPLAFVNGPIGRQVEVDHEQGMTTEEVNICLARFIEFALVNLAGVPHERGAAFGTVQALVFSEDDAAAIESGWQPYHVQQGYGLNDNTVTMTSFNMWGNNLTPATDWPEEIMKVVAWDITEKNLGGLGAADSASYADTERTILVTPPVAKALSALYKSKEALAGDLADYARRPMVMRAFAYYNADTDGVRSSGLTLDEVYDRLVAQAEEDARITVAPPWLSGITNPKVMTGAVMKPERVRILVTGDASRNKTQVMPGGKAVTVALETSEDWVKLLADLQRKSLAEVVLAEPAGPVVAPFAVPEVLSDGTYRVLDPATGSRYLTGAGRLYYDATAKTLYVYPVGGSATTSAAIDPVEYADFIAYIGNIGNNSAFTVKDGKAIDTVIRFPSNASKLDNNTVALTAEAFGGTLKLHANNTRNSPTAGGVALQGARVRLSASVTAFDVDFDGGTVTAGETSAQGFVTLAGSSVAVDTSVPPGSTAILGVANADGTYRTMSFVMRANGTYDATYNPHDTLSRTTSAVVLKWSADETADIPFAKTDLTGVYALTRHCAVGRYGLAVAAGDAVYGSDTGIVDACDRMALSTGTTGFEFQVTEEDDYTFRFDGNANTLTVVRDVTRAGVCEGGTVENVGGVYVVTPAMTGGALRLGNLSDDPTLVIEMNGVRVPGEAFRGFAEGTNVGAFALDLKAPVIVTDPGVEEPAIVCDEESVAVSVLTYPNLRYALKRAGELHEPFEMVASEGAQALGTGRAVKLIDASEDRPADKAFYKVEVGLP